MRLTEILGDPKLWDQRRAEAIRLIRAEVDRRKQNMPPPGGVERRTGDDRREDPQTIDPV